MIDCSKNKYVFLFIMFVHMWINFKVHNSFGWLKFEYAAVFTGSYPVADPVIHKKPMKANMRKKLVRRWARARSVPGPAMGTFPPGCAAEVSDATNLSFSLLASGRAEYMSQYMQCFAGAAPRRHRVLRTLGLCSAVLSALIVIWWRRHLP